MPYLKDGHHWLKGRGPDANPRWLGGSTPERQEFYRSREWKIACVDAWRRADAHCERCGLDARQMPRRPGAFDVHHIIGFACRELRAVPWNLAVLCEGCHVFVHSRRNESGVFLPGPTAPSYWIAGYLTLAEREVSTPTLFDLDAIERAA